MKSTILLILFVPSLCLANPDLDLIFGTTQLVNKGNFIELNEAFQEGSVLPDSLDDVSSREYECVSYPGFTFKMHGAKKKESLVYETSNFYLNGALGTYTLNEDKAFALSRYPVVRMRQSDEIFQQDRLGIYSFNLRFLEMNGVQNSFILRVGASRFIRRTLDRHTLIQDDFSGDEYEVVEMIVCSPKN